MAQNNSFYTQVMVIIAAKKFMNKRYVTSDINGAGNIFKFMRYHIKSKKGAYACSSYCKLVLFAFIYDTNSSLYRIVFFISILIFHACTIRPIISE